MFRVGDTETNSSFLCGKGKSIIIIIRIGFILLFKFVGIVENIRMSVTVVHVREESAEFFDVLCPLMLFFSNSISRLQVIRISFCFSFFLCEKNSSLFMVFNFVVNIFTNKLRYCHLFRRSSLHFVLPILNPIYCILPKWNGFPELSLTLSLMLCHFKVRMFN